MGSTAKDTLFSESYAAVATDGSATVRPYFPDKEALYLAVVLRGMRILNATYGECTEQESDGLKKLSKLGETLIEFSRRYPDYYRALYAGSPAQFSWPGAGAGAAMGLHDRNLELLYSAVEKWVQDGSIRDGGEPQRLIVYLIALSIGVFSFDPCWRMALTAGGVDYERFAGNFPAYAGKAIAENCRKDDS